jgi:hypothetical protein
MAGSLSRREREIFAMSRARVRFTRLGAAVAAAVIFQACGDAHTSAVVSVGGEAIPRATIGRWADEIARGATFRGVLPQLPNARAQATALLIEYRWLAGEAHNRGMAINDAEARSALRTREEGSVGGSSGYRAMLKQLGEPEGDALLAIRAELTAERLTKKIFDGTPESTASEVAVYYHGHLAEFRVPEERVFNLAERIDGTAELASAERALIAGHPVAAHTPYEAEFGESLSRDLVRKSIGDKKVAVETIFSTPVGMIGGPVKFYGHHAVFRVTRIIPSYLKPLKRVRNQIAKRLRKTTLAREHTAFLDAWRAKWTAKTKCAPGYVVPGCTEYDGPHEEEDPFTLD